jgi:hypothetical protein
MFALQGQFQSALLKFFSCLGRRLGIRRSFLGLAPATCTANQVSSTDVSEYRRAEAAVVHCKADEQKSLPTAIPKKQLWNIQINGPVG